MGELCTLDREAGDLRIEWDPAVEAEVAVARQQFDAMRAKGYVAHRLGERPGETGRIIHAFDPQARRIVLRPALRGG